MSRPRILLIEPDFLLANAYSKELEKEFRIHTCASVDDAINFLAFEIPSIIILEVFMPKHNGIDVLHDLQSYTESKDVPTVILSYSSSDDLEMSESVSARLSVCSHLYKPTITPKKLLQEVMRLKLVSYE